MENLQNRIIKFRAWDKELKKWQYFTLLQLIQGEASAIWSKLENWCRYTGLKDKNSKKVYEGDIVKTDIKMDRDFEVNFHQGVFGITAGNSGHYPLRSFTKTGTSESEIHIDVEVIGNIKENKDLLTYA